MSSVRSDAEANRSAPIRSALIFRRLNPAILYVGKVLVHAFGTDAMAEIQRAVLH